MYNSNLAHYISCPSGWEKWNGNCYLLQPEVTSMVFDAAEQGCVNHGGHLASVGSNAELDFIQSLIASYHQCGDEYWAVDPDSKKCYYYSNDKLSWNNANVSCFDADSSLVTIDSASKSEKLLSFSKSHAIF